MNLVARPGAVDSVQEAEVSVRREELERLLQVRGLERLGDAYWRHVRRVTLGLVRITSGPGPRAAVLASRRLELLRFAPADYEVGAGFGLLSWRIEGGLLVARRGRGAGRFRIYAWRAPFEPDAATETLRLRLEVRNYQPSIGGRGRLGAWLYGQTQLRIHVAVCNSFLRSLASLGASPAGTTPE
jgi:hypothetical protein